jgi:hypothetical protein
MVWYEDINKEIRRRDSACKLQGIMHTYNTDSLSKDPYEYKSLQEFKEKEPFPESSQTLNAKNVKKHCTFDKKNRQDKNNRFYVSINDSGSCKTKNGAVWDRDSISRVDNFTQGTCWTSKENMKCGVKVPNNYILSKDVVPENEQIDAFNKAKRQCNEEPDCKFVKMQRRYDCVYKKNLPRDAKKQSKPVIDPPKDMPENPTDPEANIQDYLYEWYGNKNKDNPPPEFGSLEKKEGNQCKPSSTKSKDGKMSEIEFDLNTMYTIDQLKKIPFPLDRHNRKVLKKALGDNAIEILEKSANPLSEDIWNKKELYRGVTDDEIFVETVAPIEKSVMKPSLPQSAMNMVFKKIAQTHSSTAKGMLGLHSTGSGKCHAKDTPILMYDGTIKMVQDIKEGDFLMGDDSKPRKVLSLATGEDDMYDIVPKKGDKYTVNSEHILCLKSNSEDGILEIMVSDYLLLSDEVKTDLRGYRKGVDFPYRPVTFDPYLVGYLLGGGKQRHVSNIILNYVRCMDGIDNLYKINDRDIRLRLLAGLIDSKKNNVYDIYISYKKLADDIVYLCRSLGFESYVYDNSEYFVVTVASKDVNEIKNYIRKNKSVVEISNGLEVDITVNHVGRGQYYGFTLDGNNRYLLGDFTVTHNTCTAAGIMDAFWDSNRQIIFVSSIDAVASNPPYKFHECLRNLYPRWHKYKLEEIDKMAEERGITFLSFAKMANRIKKTQELFKLIKLSKNAPDPNGVFVKSPLQYLKNIYGYKDDAFLRQGLKTSRIATWDDFVDLDNAIVIVDEVHNLFRPLATQKADHNYLESHFINRKHPELKSGFNNHNFKHDNMKIVILSATPGDNPRDVLKLLNIVRNPTNPELVEFDVDDADAIEKFKKELSGLVSYFDMSSDPGKFPSLIDNGPKKFPMSDKQFAKYIEAYKENAKQVTTTNYDKLAKANQLNKYWSKARKYSNMVYNVEDGMEVGEVSSKLPALLERIADYPTDKHYVYSSFYENKGSSQGILEIERRLKDSGYEKLTIQEAKAVNKGKTLEPKKRYMMATLREVGDSKNAGVNLNEMIKVYNRADNHDGSLLQVMLASNAFNEGIDLKGVRHIHIFEPLLTMASDKQTIGRARRYCSHADLDYDKWNVTIHRYMSDFPVSATVTNNDGISEELERMTKNVEDLEDTAKIATKETKAALKKDIASMKKRITELKREVKLKNKMDTSEIKNIDEFIYQEALTRMKKLYVLYECMKAASIDCKLLKEFHNDPDVRCMSS